MKGELMMVGEHEQSYNTHTIKKKQSFRTGRWEATIFVDRASHCVRDLEWCSHLNCLFDTYSILIACWKDTFIYSVYRIPQTANETIRHWNEWLSAFVVRFCVYYAQGKIRWTIGLVTQLVVGFCFCVHVGSSFMFSAVILCLVISFHFNKLHVNWRWWCDLNGGGRNDGPTLRVWVECVHESCSYI